MFQKTFYNLKNKKKFKKLKVLIKRKKDFYNNKIK